MSYWLILCLKPDWPIIWLAQSIWLTALSAKCFGWGYFQPNALDSICIFGKGSFSNRSFLETKRIFRLLINISMVVQTFLSLREQNQFFYKSGQPIRFRAMNKPHKRPSNGETSRRDVQDEDSYISSRVLTSGGLLGL